MNVAAPLLPENKTEYVWLRERGPQGALRQGVHRGQAGVGNKGQKAIPRSLQGGKASGKWWEGQDG